MFCKYCNNKIESNAKFCSSCGAKIEDVINEQQNNENVYVEDNNFQYKRKKDRRNTIIIVCITFGLIILIPIILFSVFVFALFSTGVENIKDSRDKYCGSAYNCNCKEDYCDCYYETSSGLEIPVICENDTGITK